MRRREIFIELTSLLDVILIMLFVLLTQARTQTSDAIERTETALAETRALQQEVDGLRAELAGAQSDVEAAQSDAEAARSDAESARRQLLSRELVTENSLVVTLTAPDRSSFALELPDGTQTISYDWENENYARNALRAALRAELDATDAPAVFLVFQYDRNTIYRTQHELVRGLLQELKLEAARRELPLIILELDTKK